ncbi:MAG: hypothetical protein AB1390_00260 [Nitrospirota bacterium]
MKVTDAKLADIRDALQAAGIKVRSIIEIFKEKEDEKQAETEGEKSYGGQEN